MKIFCNNSGCEYIKLLEKPLKFQPNKLKEPLLKNGNLCKGICTKEFCGFSSIDIMGSSMIYRLALCSQSSLEDCTREDCLWNKDKECGRKEILVDKIDIHSTLPIVNEYWVCRSRSEKGFSGHKDWSQLAKKKELF